MNFASAGSAAVAERAPWAPSPELLDEEVTLELLPNCARKRHDKPCAGEVVCQHWWVTAGLPPLTPWSKPLYLVRCTCSCHGA